MIRSTIQLFFLSLLIGIITGCATTAGPPMRVQGSSASSEKCSVTAVLNTIAPLTHIGLTRFGNENGTSDLRTARLSERIEEHTTAALRSIGKVAEVLDLGEQQDLRYLEAVDMANDFSRAHQAVRDRRRQIEAIATARGYQCAITIMPAQAHIGGFNYFGAGLFSTSRAGNPAGTYFVGRVYVTSPATDMIIATRGLSNDPMSDSRGRSHISLVLDGSRWRNPENMFQKVLQDTAVQDFLESLEPLSKLVAENVKVTFTTKH